MELLAGTAMYNYLHQHHSSPSSADVSSIITLTELIISTLVTVHRFIFHRRLTMFFTFCPLSALTPSCSERP